MMKALSLVAAAALVAGGAIGCQDDDHDTYNDHADRGGPPLIEPGRDASGARSPGEMQTMPPPNPNGAPVGATGSGAGGGENHLNTNMGPR